MVQDGDPIPDGGVDETDARVHLTGRADLRRTLETNAGVQDRVLTDLDVHVHVGGRRVHQCDAGRHQFFVLLLSNHTTHLCQFAPAVDAANLAGVRHGPGGHRPALPPIDGDQVGQVILALRVLGADAPQRVEKPFQVEGIDPGIDFLDLPLRRRGVTLLDDPGHLAPGPDDPPVAIRAVHGGGDDGRRRPGGAMGVEQRAQGRAGQERHVARQQDDCPGLADQGGFGLQQRVAGSQLRFLNNRNDIWVMT